VLQDLKERLRKTRWSPNFNTRGMQYGQERSLQESLLSHWVNAYDWRKYEFEINSFSNFKLKVHGLDVHFIHERSRVPGAIPILLIHGWPGSVWEFHKAIPMLVNPADRALRLKQAFHVVAPSLPGYGWSEASQEPGMGTQEIAEMFNELMRRLGYDKYYAQGGDWGAFITRQLALAYPSNCIALHTNMPIAFPSKPKDVRGSVALLLAMVDTSPLGKFSLSQSEREGLDRSKEYMDSGDAYMRLQSSKPHTLGFALADSPSGLLAWISEKLQLWTDGRGNVLNALSKDEILTNIMIYWVTNCYTSSARLYYESNPSGKQRPDKVKLERSGYVEVPTGVAAFPKEIMRLPRRWISMHYNLVHYTEFSEGGHFAAWEQPELFVQDLRIFAFRSMPFEKACQLAEEREMRAKTSLVTSTNQNLATKLLLLAPALPVPFVAGIAVYLLSSKL